MARMDLEMKLKSLGLVKTPQNGFLLTVAARVRGTADWTALKGLGTYSSPCQLHPPLFPTHFLQKPFADGASQFPEPVWSSD